MASSEVVTTNTDLPRDSNSYYTSSSSLSTLLSDPVPIPMDDIIKSISIFPPHLPPPPPPNSADDLWGNFFPSRDAAPQSFGGMNLEQFLHKNAPPPITSEEHVTGVSPPPPPSATSQFSVSAEGSSSVEPFGSGAVDRAVGGKGKRKAVVEPTDKATLQKQRRMIKNRESAARSRERKQAYTSELEYLVQQLEQENARLLKEEAEKKKQRLKQLTECLIPIVEKKPSPKRRLLRTNSVQSM